MAFIKGVFADYKHLSPASRYIFQLGGVLVGSLVLAAVFTYLLAENADNYAAMLWLSQELFAVVRPCLGVLGLGAIAFQAVASYNQPT